MSTFFKYYKFAFLATLAVFLLVGFSPLGWSALPALLILSVLEISFSFDNAVVNAKVLKKMSDKWQRIFMTVGILVAVFGMRFVFPIVVVMLVAHLGFFQVVDLALNNPHEYAHRLGESHEQIAVFAGVFLLMIFLDFIFEERDVTWLPFEKSLAKAGKLDSLSLIIALGAVLGITMALDRNQLSVILAGSFSLLIYKIVNALANIFEDEDESDENGNEDDLNSKGKTSGAPVRTGMAAFLLFIYLEVQDAMFSFDGVGGAFAITDKVVLIAAGLGVGALYVRSMTIHLLKSGKLAELRYLEHGAHWAIGILAICLLLTTFVEIPDWVTGLIGIVFIAVSIVQSIRVNKRDARARQAALALTAVAAASTDDAALVDATKKGGCRVSDM